MNRIRSLVLIGTSLGLAACADKATELVAPMNASVQNDRAGGYTWTIKKEMVQVEMQNSDLAMVVDNVRPYAIKPNETKWFDYRITWTRTTGGNMGPTAVISDDMAAACSSLGAGFSCTSCDCDFGLPGGAGAIGVKTWTVTESGSKEGMFDVHNDNAACPKDRNLKNVATLTSNGVTKSSRTDTPVRSTNCGESSEQQHCNQGVGNGPEGCDPGNSDAHKGSNDENGGVPGAPGRQGGGH